MMQDDQILQKPTQRRKSDTTRKKEVVVILSALNLRLTRKEEAGDVFAGQKN